MVAKRTPHIPQGSYGPLTTLPDPFGLPNGFTYQTQEGQLYFAYEGAWVQSDKVVQDRVTAHANTHVPRIIGDQALALQRFRTSMAGVRGGIGYQFGSIVCIGDSLTEGFYCSDLRYRWTEILRRRLKRNHPSDFRGEAYFIPSVSGNGKGNLWPGPIGGGLDPWTHTGATAAVDNTNSPNLALLNIPAGGKVSTTVVGDSIMFSYAKGPTYPNSNSTKITIDGVVQATLNQFNAAVSYSNTVSYAAPNGYGIHTVEIENVGASAINFEGIFVFDRVANGGMAVYNYGNGGSTAQNWANAAAGGWDNIVATNSPDLIIIELGTNDRTVGRTAAQFQADLQTIVDRCEAKIAVQNAPKSGYLFLGWSAIEPAAGMVPYWDAMKAVAAAVPGSRGLFMDLAAEMGPNTNPSYTRTLLTADGIHPGTNNAGHYYVADALGRLLDPSPVLTNGKKMSAYVPTAGAGTFNFPHQLDTGTPQVMIQRPIAVGGSPAGVVNVNWKVLDTNTITIDFDTYVRVANEFVVTCST